MDYKEYDENVTIYYLERLKRISLMNDIEREDFLNNLLVYTKQNYITIESDIIYSYIQGCLLPVYLGVSYKIQSCLVDLIILYIYNTIIYSSFHPILSINFFKTIFSILFSFLIHNIRYIFNFIFKKYSFYHLWHT